MKNPFSGLRIKREAGENDFSWNMRQIERNIKIATINIVIAIVFTVAAVIIRIIR
jgi:hypothetical protein